jgi:hypothetical protein
MTWSQTADKFARLKEQSSRLPHGQNARYVSGCRCDLCRRANRTQGAETRYPSNGHGHTVSTGRARRHILRLGEQGMGYLAVSMAAGVNKGIVWGIRQGQRLKARYGTVKAILDVDLGCARSGSRIPAGPAWAILDRMIADGYSRMQIARWLGSRAKNPAIQIPRDFCTAESMARVRKVKALLDAGKLERGKDSPLAPVKPRGIAPGAARMDLRGKYRSDAPRCACRKMTLKCAKVRAHHCEVKCG